MKENFNTILIEIIRSAFLKQKVSALEGFDTRKLLKVAKDSHITNIVYTGLINSGVSKKEPFMQKLFLGATQDLIKNEHQMRELSLVFEQFEKNNISYMPLKGAKLKKIYPLPEMRVMGDADLLIDTKEYPKIERIVKDLGYTFECESNHEYIYRKETLLLELHKMLIPSYNLDFYSYFGGGFSKAEKISGKSEYTLCPEDEFIYLFTHFAKHYRDGGIGIKHLTDIWVFINHHKNLNKEYIEKELKKLSLYEFYLNIIQVIRVWFENEKPTSISDFITEVIIESSAYGTHKAHLNAQALRLSKGKNRALKMFISKLFPSLAVMKIRYKVLEKYPFLLPIMWVIRIADALFHKKERVRSGIVDIKGISEKEVREYEKALRYVGLSFKYKEQGR